MFPLPTINAIYVLASIPFFYCLYIAQQPLLLVLFATILAVGSSGLVAFVAGKLSLPYAPTFLLLLTGGLILLGLLSWLVVPQLQQEFAQFTSTIQNSNQTELTQLVPFVNLDQARIMEIVRSNSSPIIGQAQSLLTSSITFV